MQIQTTPPTATQRIGQNKSNRFKRWIAWGGALAAASATCGLCADSTDPLLDVLIRKGVITEQEAKEVKAEMQTNSVNTAASKWKISDSIKSINLFGDLRFRYEYRAADNPQDAGLTTGDTYQRERFRYALRVGLRGDLLDNFNYGVRVETSSNPRSPWVTFGDDSNPTPSAKNSDSIGVGQAFLGWKPADWYEMTVGKMPMPLYTTPMIWDADINPEGAFEKFKYSFKYVDVFAGFGQFMYQDTSPDVETPTSDTWIFAWQLGANVKLTKEMSFKVAPVVYTYRGQGSGNGLNLAYSGQGAANGSNSNNIPALNQNGINDLLILEVPAEFNVKFGKYHGRLFGDFAYNFEGEDRARAAAAVAGLSKAYTDQIKAYQVGVGVGNEGPNYGPTQGLVYGSTSKKGTWEARVYWQHVEQYAEDVNLMDSDFLEGRGNLQGIYSAFAYSITDGIIGTVRYGYAEQINKNLGTGGNNPDLPALNPIKNYNLLPTTGTKTNSRPRSCVGWTGRLPLRSLSARACGGSAGARAPRRPGGRSRAARGARAARDRSGRARGRARETPRRSARTAADRCGRTGPPTWPLLAPPRSAGARSHG